MTPVLKTAEDAEKFSGTLFLINLYIHRILNSYTDKVALIEASSNEDNLDQEFESPRF